VTTALRTYTQIPHGRRMLLQEDWLSMPLGSKPTLSHYAAAILDEVTPVRFVVSDRVQQRFDAQQDESLSRHREMAAELNRSILSRPVCDGRAMLLIDAGRLPDIRASSAWQCHRRSGGPVTIFFDTVHVGYCRERLATDARGVVSGAVRDYSDSFPNNRPHIASPERIPVAAGLSRAASKALSRLDFATFAELIDYLQTDGEWTVGGVVWVRTPAVRVLADPFDRLLHVIEQCGVNNTHEEPATSPRGFVHPTARLFGPILIGRNVRIGAHAVVIGPTAIGDNARIEQRAVLARSVVLPDTIVPADRCHYRMILPGRGEDAVYHVPPSTGYAPAPARADHAPIEIQRPALSKQCLDFVAAAIGLAALAPVLAVIAVAIKLTSRGPILYRHRRQGLGGIEFDCLKFRTMIPDADRLQARLRQLNEVDGPQFKLSHDPRITRVGHFLRRTNLDELPQLYNVLKGQMSLVGPRPSPDNENQFCPVWRKNRLSVLPGITGLWQVTRSPDRKADFQEWIYYDLQYVKYRSTWLDLQILWQTLRVVARLGPSKRWRRRWRPTAS